MRNVLVIAAHPDDETLGAGGAIALHRQLGDNVEVLILTDGVTARHQVAEPQKDAARRACSVLGVEKVHFAGLPDQRLDGLALIDVITPISSVIGNLSPEIVFTHHSGDANQDHRTVFAATLVACRPSPGAPVRRLLAYEVVSSTEWGPPLPGWSFLPNYFVNIEATLDAKLRAFEVYRETFQSEVKDYPHPRSIEGVRQHARYRGQSIGVGAAEAFALIRHIE